MFLQVFNNIIHPNTKSVNGFFITFRAEQLYYLIKLILNLSEISEMNSLVDGLSYLPQKTFVPQNLFILSNFPLLHAKSIA